MSQSFQSKAERISFQIEESVRKNLKFTDEYKTIALKVYLVALYSNFFFFFFYNNIHTVQETLDVDGYRLRVTVYAHMWVR